jgi:hypothetical protein
MLTASITLTIKAVSTPATLVNFYETTQRIIPEACHLHTQELDNLESHSLTEIANRHTGF